MSRQKPSSQKVASPKPVTIARKVGLGARLRAYFLAGILVTAPLSFTFYVAWLFVGFVDQTVAALLPPRFNPETYMPFSLPGIGVLTVVVFLVVVGWLTAGFLGRFLLRTSESVVNRIPAVRQIYAATKQILETVLSQKSQAFREVVLVEYPRRGIWAVGFITGLTQGEVQNLTQDTLVNIFLPTTPNPTSGFLLFVPKRDLVVLNMSVEEGIKMVISGGIVTPPDRRSPEEQEQPRLTAGGSEGATSSPVEPSPEPASPARQAGRSP